jgi:uncharacterized phage-associated protein
MSYPASIIAAIFVKRAIKEHNFLTQMKLQKLVYIAHGYHLAKYGAPLINDQVQAWKFGPVVPVIYQDYKLYGSNMITGPDLIKFNQFDKADESQISDSAKDAIEFTWKLTNKLSAAKLSDWTHIDGSPWQKVYKEGHFEIPIEDSIIKDYFTDFIYPNGKVNG